MKQPKLIHTLSAEEIKAWTNFLRLFSEGLRKSAELRAAAKKARTAK